MISLGYMHTCSISSDLTLTCWGNNLNMQLNIQYYNNKNNLIGNNIMSGGDVRAVYISSLYWDVC